MTRTTIKKTTAGSEQPEPFTPGVRKSEVRDQAFKMFRVKLEAGEPLTRGDWIRAEKELVREREEEES
ncbi:MAG: hypothetical protein N2689_03060 [Verrucomicrobiae bacterium]|nr:hypothetical protein [Verrucomicrobiae bacterium]